MDQTPVDPARPRHPLEGQGRRHRGAQEGWRGSRAEHQAVAHARPTTWASTRMPPTAPSRSA
jgi:hypothetical protein